MRLWLNALRSIPTLDWGIILVAAVGFGPLPGVLALVCHSTGMRGKFYAEIQEHIDPALGNALCAARTAPVWASCASPSGPRSCRG